MLVQTKIATIEVNDKKGKRHRPDVPSYRKTDKIKDFIKEWNTIENIELYEPLYKVCSQLFLITQDRKLENVSYFIDHERDSEKGEEYTVMYAEINDTWHLPLQERYNKHKELLKRVMSNDTTLSYCSDSIIQSDEGQLSLFA